MYGKSLFFNTSKAEKILKWNSKHSNKDMIKESYDWYIDNRLDLLSNKSKKSLHKSAVKQGLLYIAGKLL